MSGIVHRQCKKSEWKACSADAQNEIQQRMGMGTATGRESSRTGRRDKNNTHFTKREFEVNSRNFLLFY